MTNANKKLDSDITLGGEPLSAVAGDADEAQVIGYLATYTIGDALIPRQWLVQRADELGIPEYIIPSEPRSHVAYSRGIKRLEGKKSERQRRVMGYDAEIQFYNPEEAERYLQMVELKVYFPESETNTEGGETVNHTLGFFDYDKDTGSVRSVQKLKQPGPDASESEQQRYQALKPIWDELVGEFTDPTEGWFEKMKQYHTGQDLRNSIRSVINDHTNTVIPLRSAGAVYFFPAQLGDQLEAWATLLSEINDEFKTGGKEAQLRTARMINEDAEVEWVEEQVREEMSKAVDDLLEEAWQALDDEEDTAEEIATEVLNNITDTMATAEQYNSLLEAQLSVEEILENRQAKLSDEDKQDIVERVLSADGQS